MKTTKFETSLSTLDSKDEFKVIFDKLKLEPYINNILDALPSVALILNKQRQILFGNKALLQVLNKTDIADSLGLRPGDIFKCIHAQKHRAGCGSSENCTTCGAVLTVLDCQEKQISTNREARISTTNHLGQLVSYDFLVSASPFQYKDQLYTVVVLTDISHEKRRRILERIFFHDILNTAGNVGGLSELALRSEEEKKEEYLALINMVSRQLVNEIKSQRVLLAAENDEFTVTIEEANAAEILNYVVDSFKTHELARGINIEADVLDVTFETDKTLLSRVLINMIKNAIEASSKGETIFTGCSQTEEKITFRVNNRKVIPKDVQLQIFQRSFSTKGAGRGLGAYSIKLLSEKYLSGNVSFTSTEDTGTTFTVTYPIKQEQEA